MQKYKSLKSVMHMVRLWDDYNRIATFDYRTGKKVWTGRKHAPGPYRYEINKSALLRADKYIYFSR